jgi:hypothetical protein
MVQKPVVRSWHRTEYAEGKKDNIPAAALAILDAEKKEKPEKKEKKEHKGDE